MAKGEESSQAQRASSLNILQKFCDVYCLEAATTDWLDTPEQQMYLLEQAAVMLPHLSEEHQRRSWRRGLRRRRSEGSCGDH